MLTKMKLAQGCNVTPRRYSNTSQNLSNTIHTTLK